LQHAFFSTIELKNYPAPKLMNNSGHFHRPQKEKHLTEGMSRKKTSFSRLGFSGQKKL
jgi:hypothetical protein